MAPVGDLFEIASWPAATTHRLVVRDVRARLTPNYTQESVVAQKGASVRKLTARALATQSHAGAPAFLGTAAPACSLITCCTAATEILGSLAIPDLRGVLREFLTTTPPVLQKVPTFSGRLQIVLIALLWHIPFLSWIIYPFKVVAARSNVDWLCARLTHFSRPAPDGRRASSLAPSLLPYSPTDLSDR